MPGAAPAMFLRHEPIGTYAYLYLVESVYEDGHARRHIIRNPGRREDVEARGDPERSAKARGTTPALGCRRIGPGLIFERPWSETGCRAA